MTPADSYLTWLLVGIVWITFSLLVSLALGLIARVGVWRERRGGK